MALERRPIRSDAVERGVSAVEWIILLPVLCVLIAAVIIFGTRYSDILFISQTTHELALVVARVPGMDRVSAPPALTPKDVTYRIDFNVEEAVVSDAEASACANCLVDNTCGPTPSDTDCMTKLVKWYALQFLATKNMLVQGHLAMTVSYSTGTDLNPSDPIPTVTVGMTINPLRWLLPDWMALFDPITIGSTVPYMVLP